MEVTINGTKYRLTFGIRFSHECNQIFFPNGFPDPKQPGEMLYADFGHGVRQLAGSLQSGNAAALYQLFKAATATEDASPSMEDVDAYIAEQAKEGKRLHDVCAFFLEQLFQAPSLDGLKEYCVMLENIKTQAFMKTFLANIMESSGTDSATSDTEPSKT